MPYATIAAFCVRVTAGFRTRPHVRTTILSPLGAKDNSPGLSLSRGGDEDAILGKAQKVVWGSGIRATRICKARTRSFRRVNPEYNLGSSHADMLGPDGWHKLQSNTKSSKLELRFRLADEPIPQSRFLQRPHLQCTHRSAESCACSIFSPSPAPDAPQKTPARRC